MITITHVTDCLPTHKPPLSSTYVHMSFWMHMNARSFWRFSPKKTYFHAGKPAIPRMDGTSIASYCSSRYSLLAKCRAQEKKNERKNDEVDELLSKKPFLGKGGNAAKKKLRYYLARTFILQKKWTKTEKNWFKKWVSHLAVRLTSHWYLNKVILNSTRRNPCIRLAAYLRPQWGGELPGRISAPKKKWRSVMRGLMAAFSWSLCIEFVNNW